MFDLTKCHTCMNTWEYIKFSANKRYCSACRGREPANPHTHILPGLNRHQLRAIIFDHYGRKCVICQRTNIETRLCIDHVFENGSDERKQFSEARLLRNIIKLGFPDTYQILCYRCNIAKSDQAAGRLVRQAKQR
jgi:type II secretory ATPase GspE/PulE/Tfp pilus assembly ATPase PilB-like protein